MHHTKHVMDNPLTLVKKDYKHPSSGSSKGSKKNVAFKEFMQCLEQPSDGNNISLTESYFYRIRGLCAQDLYGI